MPKFSQQSLDRLSTCHPDLQRVFAEIIKHFDCTILEGHRGRAAQDKAFAEGKSKLKWPHGKHNAIPSMAVDAAPYPVDWLDTRRMAFLAGQVVATARGMGIKIRWGGDWDGDTDLKENKFNDLVHFELLT